MTVVQQSSSHDSSSVALKNAAPRSFDVGSEKELLNLLIFIRRGPFLPDQKNMLRDIVLDFVVSKDISVLEVVESALIHNSATLTNNGTPLSSVPPAPPNPDEGASKPDTTPSPSIPHEQTQQTHRGFAGSRPQPSFGQEPANQNSLHNPEAMDQVYAPSTDSNRAQSAEDIHANPTQTEPDTTEPVAFKPEPEPAAETQATPPTASQDVPTEQAKHTDAAPATPEESIAPPMVTDPLTRIKEIKNLVNKRVGNPVNLIDANNTIGREYMNALLGAMKSVNGGTSETVALAMQRLEKAFQTIEQSLELGTITPKDTQKKTEALDTLETIKTETSEPVVEPTEPPPVSQVEAQTEQKIEEQPVIVSEESQVVDSNIPEPAQVSQQKEEEPTPEGTIPDTVTEHQALSSPIHESATVPPASLAAQLQQQQEALADTAAQKLAETKVQKDSLLNDPLNAEEVSRGLHQLLSEWKLFKSSGIFGTGPNGQEHPLYRSIAPLPMAAVIAGRFDSVTPEIRQSISDYMSGWRYEQGVVHEMNESFEHYLRRVVHKILEKQKKNQVV